MRGKSVHEVCQVLGGLAGTLSVVLAPRGRPRAPPAHRVLHVRAHFDYDPEDDVYIPCRELGISFQKGDVLHVISREDPNWWQAFREGEEDQTLAGLIPSQAFQHQRESMKLSLAGEAGEGERRARKGATLLCAGRVRRRKPRKPTSEAGYPIYAASAPDGSMEENHSKLLVVGELFVTELIRGSRTAMLISATEYCCNAMFRSEGRGCRCDCRHQRLRLMDRLLAYSVTSHLALLIGDGFPIRRICGLMMTKAVIADYEQDEILTYEEVALYYPRASNKRPIVLIGPPNIGRHELRQRLMEDSSRFAAAVPHTSRARKDHEAAGQDYHFISRAQFEADILNRKFVEHGEYEKAYYGTSLEAIREVVNSGKICVLNLHPQSLKILRGSDLKPYTVFVAPPSLEKLRQKKIRNGEAFKEEELKEIIATARDMELRWGHLFDMIIINNDTQRAYHQLLNEINSLEREPQWVPAHWLKQT
ncbi:jg3928 [Pararge aegeria aegeria]|nr:jg3928 [Pararge aegeria aegeria]